MKKNSLRAAIALTLGTALFQASEIQAQTSFTNPAVTTGWNASRWNNAVDGPTYTAAYAINQPVNFTTGPYTFSTGIGTGTINIGNVTLSNNVTVDFTGTVAGTYATGGTVRTIDVGTNSTFNMAAQGVSTAVGTGFIKNGAGTWITAGGAYTGGFTLNAGTLALAGVNGMGAGGALTINGGTIRSSSTTARDLTGKYTSGITVGGDFTVGDATNNGQLTFTNSMALGGVTRTITANSTTIFGGALNGAGAGILKNGAGTLRLNGANGFTGTVEVSNGILQIANYSGLSNASSLTVSGGGSSNLQLVQVGTGATTNSINKSLSLHGTLSTAGGSAGNTLAQTMVGNITLAGNSTITNNGNSSIDIDGNINLGAHTLTYQADGAGSRIDGNISGTGSLNKTSTQGLTLGGANDYTGATTISAGILSLNNANALGTIPGTNGTSGISMVSGTVLQSATPGTNPTTTIAAPITLSGVGDATLRIGQGAGSNTHTFSVNGAIGGTTGTLTYTTGTGSHSNGASVIVIGAAGTYTGNTRIASGNGANNPLTVSAGVGIVDAMPSTTVLSFVPSAGSGSGRSLTYDLNSNNQTLAGLDYAVAVSNDRNIRVSSTNAATLIINNATDFSFGGANIDVGTSIPGTLTSAQITGAIALTKSGAGTFTLGGLLTNGATAQGNAFTGDTKITAGILVLGENVSIRNSAFDTGASILGTASDGLRVGVGGTGVTTLTIGGLKGANDFSTRFTATTGGYSNLTALTLNPGIGATPSYAGDIGNGAGSLNLLKTGAGTQTLTGANTYSGNTTVNLGSLVVAGTLLNNHRVLASNFIAAPDDTLADNPTLTRRILNADFYAGLGTTSNGGLNTTAELLAGTVLGTGSSNADVSMQWRTRTADETTATPTTPRLISNVLDLSGVAIVSGSGSTAERDLFVLQLNYDPTAAASPSDIYLATYDTVTNSWVNAVATNAMGTNNASLAQQGYLGDFASFQTAYGTTLSSYVGAWGVDTVTTKAWAVLNHNSEFAVIPEPSVFVAGTVISLALAGFGLRRRRSKQA